MYRSLFLIASLTTAWDVANTDEPLTLAAPQGSVADMRSLIAHGADSNKPSGGNVEPIAVTSPAITPSTAAAENDQGFLYGRITTYGGAAYEGRLRFGGDEEAFWGDYFNGSKTENPWAAQAPLERLPKERERIEIFGIEIGHWERQIDLNRFFMARFGDIARIEARGRDVRVTLKSGTVFDLDRFSASDFDDGGRVWDGKRGVVDLDSLRIRSIELLPTAPLDAAPYRLHGTVRTRQDDFTGFVQWDREDCVGPDELDGRTVSGERSVRFDIRSIARRSRDSSGPAYDGFPLGRRLTGSVTTRAGRRLAGRLVYDLDESETTETLDAPSQGVNYTIPFGLIASIVRPGPEERGAQRARVILQNGEELQLDPTGDLGREECRHADLRRGPSPPRVRALDRSQAGRLRPPAGDVSAARRALDPALPRRPSVFWIRGAYAGTRNRPHG